jgi:hypothetical protein
MCIFKLPLAVTGLYIKYYSVSYLIAMEYINILFENNYNGEEK